MYVLFFGLIGGLGNACRIFLCLSGLLVAHTLHPHWIPYFSDKSYSDVLKVGMFFMAGVAAYGLRNSMSIRLRHSIPPIFLAFVLQGTPVQEYALYAALFHLVLVASASTRLRILQPRGDYSFGVYIYGWPIQQTVNHLLPDLTSYPSNLICIPVALLAGYLSWNFVEKPVLAFSRRMTSKRRPHVSGPPPPRPAGIT